MKQTFFGLLVLLLMSCQKKQFDGNSDTLLNQAIDYFNQNASTGIIPDKNAPRKSVERHPNWNKSIVLQHGKNTTIIAPLIFKKDMLVRTSKGGDLYSLNDISYIMLVPDAGRFKIRYLTIVPFKYRRADPFNGILHVEDEQGQFVFAIKFDKNQRFISVPNHSTVQLDGIIRQEHYIEGYNYSPEDPTGGYSWQEYIGTSYYYIPDSYGYGGGNNTNTGPGSDLNLGGLLDIAESISPSNFIVPAGDDKITDLNAYLKCFKHKQGNTYQVTLYMQQPIPGTRATWQALNGVDAAKQKSPVFVGHTFIALKQIFGTDTLVRNLGYYPSKAVDPLNPITFGQLNNDQQRAYNLSLTINISLEQLTSILNYINSGITYYNLNTFNCTNFALDALAKGGINLPRTEGSWPNGKGLNPGDLGEDVRNMPIASNMSKSTNMTTHTNKGSCN